MKSVLEEEPGGAWTVRRVDGAGRPVWEVRGALPVSVLSRRLGKSRRQVYRYLRDGDLVPVGKFLG